MFSAYPGFEELPLRLTVQHKGRARPVVAHLEQWPDSDKAVVCCGFEDEASGEEWLIANNRGLYERRAPRQMLRRIVDSSGARPRAGWRLSSRAQSQLRYLVESAFHPYSPVATLVRAVYLPQLPASPRVAIQRRVNASWCDEPGHTNFTQFRVPDLEKGFAREPRAAQRQLHQLWRDPQSDARFAWQWASLSHQQRLRALTGYDGEMSELGRAMELILKSSPVLWRGASFWCWNFNIDPALNRYFGAGQAPSEASSALLARWSALLCQRFVPRGQVGWPGKHHCIPSALGALATVVVRQAPSAHEQLEAKLALRDWLGTAATSQGMKTLL